MTVSLLVELLSNLGIVLICPDGENLELNAPRGLLTESYLALIREYKSELIAILTDQRDYGTCEHCLGKLLGLPTFDGYINRYCPKCDLHYRAAPRDDQPVPPIRADNGLVSEKRRVCDKQMSYIPC